MFGDRRQLCWLFQNLIRNASRHRKATRSVDKWVFSMTDSDSDSDIGIGIGVGVGIDIGIGTLHQKAIFSGRSRGCPSQCQSFG